METTKFFHVKHRKQEPKGVHGQLEGCNRNLRPKAAVIYWFDFGWIFDTLLFTTCPTLELIDGQSVLFRISGGGGGVREWHLSPCFPPKSFPLVFEAGYATGPKLFRIYINDVLSNIKSSLLLLFTDDAKLFKKNCTDDCILLQRDINSLYV